jgi:hypothetical protein
MYVHIGPGGRTSNRPPVAGRTGRGGRGSPGVRANRRKLRDGKVKGTKVPKIRKNGPFLELFEAVRVRRGAMSARLLELRQRTRKGDGAKHGS